MHDDVGAREGVLENGLIAYVAAAVVQLRPAMLVGVEWAPGDSDDPLDPPILLEQGHQAEPECPCRPGYRNGESCLSHSP